MAHPTADPRHGLGACLAAALVLSACSPEPPAPDAFYAIAEAEIAGTPGDLLRAEPFAGAPAGSNAWRVLYRSTGLDGEPIAVSGVIVAPERPQGVPQKVVAWAHPTTGVASRCAPSLDEGFFWKIPGLEGLLERGYVIAATDYPGLGTPGPHPYLVGVSQGRAVLDAARAAGRLPGVEASRDVALWGHSQGAHAALFAGQIAAAYAPELRLAGVAAAAPPTDLAALLRDDLDSVGGKVLTSLAVWSWSRVYGAPLTGILDDSAIAAVDSIAEDCLEGALQGLIVAHDAHPIEHDFLKVDLTETEPWRSLIESNSPAAHMDAPLFIAQGAADTAIRPQVTIGYAHRACRTGTRLRFLLREGADHLKIATDAAEEVVAWIDARFAGAAAPDDCGALPEAGASG